MELKPHRLHTQHAIFFFYEIIETERNSRQIDEMSDDVLLLFIFLFVTSQCVDEHVWWSCVCAH